MNRYGGIVLWMVPPLSFRDLRRCSRKEVHGGGDMTTACSLTR